MKRKPTKRSPAGQQALDEFRDRWHGQTCWLCPMKLGHHIHHIVERDGKIYDDRRNFAWLCGTCHDRFHKGPQIVYSVKLPAWTDEDVLRAKKLIDPEHWDLAFLRLLAGPGDGRLNMEFGRGME